MKTFTKILIMLVTLFIISGCSSKIKTSDMSPPVTDIPDTAKENPDIGTLPPVTVSTENPIQNVNDIPDIPDILGENPDIGGIENTNIAIEAII